MFAQKQPQASAAGKGGAFNRCISLLAGAAGIGIAILATPPIFEATRGPLFSYLAKTWGSDVANVLTWVFAGVEAVLIYALVRLVILLGVTLAVSVLATLGLSRARE